MRLPLARPRPDIERFIAVLMGRARARVPLVEYIVDEAVQRPIVTGLLGRAWVDGPGDRASQAARLDNVIEFWLRLGYDAVRFEAGLPFPENKVLAPDPAVPPGGSGSPRAWAEEHAGTIATWEDFVRYPWPRIEDFDFFPFDYLDRHLPDGLGLLASHAGGVFEHLSWIMSLEGLAFALADSPALVRAVADRVGELLEQFTRRLLSLDRLAAVFGGDDMGFRSGTLISPARLRELVLPWHRRLAALAHGRGIPYFLHSCGRVDAILADLVDSVGIDGKHSFEDAIAPAEVFQERTGGRIAVLGGVDLNILAAGSPADVRRRTRALIERCGPRGRFAVGSGNSIPSYVPPENYLAMVSEALA